MQAFAQCLHVAVARHRLDLLRQLLKFAHQQDAQGSKDARVASRNLQGACIVETRPTTSPHRARNDGMSGEGCAQRVDREGLDQDGGKADLDQLRMGGHVVVGRRRQRDGLLRRAGLCANPCERSSAAKARHARVEEEQVEGDKGGVFCRGDAVCNFDGIDIQCRQRIGNEPQAQRVVIGHEDAEVRHDESFGVRCGRWRLAEWSAMRISSMPMAVLLCLAGWLLAAGAAHARTLTFTIASLQAPQVSARNLRMQVSAQGEAGQLGLSIAQLDMPTLDLSGQLAWSCTLLRQASGARTCSGLVRLVGNDGSQQSAELSVTVVAQQVAMALARDGSRVEFTWPGTGDAPATLSLRQVPASWLKAPVALAWKGGELRNGTLDVLAHRQGDGRIDAHYAVVDASFNTLDGSVSANGLAASGEVSWESSASGSHVSMDAAFSAGTLRAGALQVVLPDALVSANLDATVQPDGRWDIARFAWRDADTLAFEASGSLDPGQLAPLDALDVRIRQARFPLAAQHYAGHLLAQIGLDHLALRGEVVGEIAVDRGGVQRIALTTDALDVDDPAHALALKKLSGGIDWAAKGERPPTRIGWKSARIDTVALASASARWQSKDGALHLLDPLRMKLFGGTLQLERTKVETTSREGARVQSAFTLKGIGYDSKDGSLAAAKLAASGAFDMALKNGNPRIRAQVDFHGGQLLAGPVYVELPPAPVAASIDATLAGDAWRVDAFDWSDPGVLALGASGVIAPNGSRPLQALQLDVREANLAPALARYAHSWLSAKGYAELEGKGTLVGTLAFGMQGLERFAFTAHAVGLHDGGGRFAVTGIEGGVDWRPDGESPPTMLGWKTLEFFRIPLGPADARLAVHNGAIVLAQPLAVALLGGQLQLEKLSLQPRSPRGERYAASFAVVGVEMPQLSSALDWPRFGGTLSGGIPEIELAGDAIELHGGLDLYVFDGHIGVSGLRLERPFGVAPSLGADIHFENLDLDRVTRAFSFGGMTGRLDGSITDARLLDWSPVAFDAWLHADKGGRMSYKAVNDLTAIGGGGLSSGLQTMALKLFDSFGYRRLGLRCRLRDEVCLMGGIDPLPATGAVDASAGYPIVEGSGLPRILIVGHRRRVDWPTLVRRLLEATRGQGPLIE